jgi:putative membrane protein
MNTARLGKVIRRAALAPVALLVAGLLCGQGMNSPQGQYPQTQQRQPGLNPGGQDQTMPSPAFSDEDFAKDAAQGGMAEVTLGQLAEDKGSSDVVKDFGKRMVEDHSKANDRLKEAAEHEKMKLPTQLSKRNQKAYDRLSELSGDAFDRAYARDMVRDHQNDIAAFKQEASSGQNAAIKNFALQTLPTLEDHLKMAREMEQTLGKPVGKSEGQ